MAWATCLLVAVTALAAPCAALVTAPGLGVVRDSVLRHSFVSVRVAAPRAVSPDGCKTQLGSRLTHNALPGQAAAARNAPYPMPRRACRSLAPLRGGAAASSASLSPDFMLKTFAPLMVPTQPTQCRYGWLAR